MKSILLAGFLVLSGLSIANAKSYHFALDRTAKAGTVVLQPGDYSVKLEGASAVFTNAQTDKSLTTAVTVANADKKHPNTAVVSTTKNGESYIQSIELGGSRETLDFKD